MSLNQKHLPFFIAVLLGIGIYMGSKLNTNSSSYIASTKNSSKQKFNKLIDYIEYEYVDPVDTDSIIENFIDTVLQNLDPHSSYIPKQDLMSVTENMKGDFIGIGVRFYIYKDSIAVIRAIEGGPSFRAGILAGDRILIADDDTLYGQNWSESKVIERLRGEKNSKVQLKIKREGVDSLLNFEIIRSEVPIKSVVASYMINPTLGYVRINRFAESTYLEFENNIEDLISKGALNLVLDLRDNPGGFLQIAMQIADEFLEDGKLILFTKNKTNEIDKTFATAKGRFEEAEVYVLINENSASASEIVAGALQDNDKGTIIGRRSFGKGLVQQEMDLGDGSAIRLTTSRYYTPTGRSIQRSYDKGSEAYYDDYYERLEDRAVDTLQLNAVVDSLIFTTPKGKIVYGGGGIIPDVYVPYDANFNNDIVEYLKVSGMMDFFVFEYLDGQRAQYTSLSEAEFLSAFEISEDIYQQFISNFSERISLKNEEIHLYKNALKILLKSAFAKQLFGDNTAAKVMSTFDPMLQKTTDIEAALISN
ncbi:MAG: S41 family peptidase [Flavobacteriaceae bacterium]|nr:S41 family peptidase [Flavobacteriaceae bacterium]